MRTRRRNRSHATRYAALPGSPWRDAYASGAAMSSRCSKAWSNGLLTTWLSRLRRQPSRLEAKRCASYAAARNTSYALQRMTAAGDRGMRCARSQTSTHAWARHCGQRQRSRRAGLSLSPRKRAILPRSRAGSSVTAAREALAAPGRAGRLQRQSRRDETDVFVPPTFRFTEASRGTRPSSTLAAAQATPR